MSAGTRLFSSENLNLIRLWYRHSQPPHTPPTAGKERELIHTLINSQVNDSSLEPCHLKQCHAKSTNQISKKRKSRPYWLVLQSKPIKWPIFCFISEQCFKILPPSEAFQKGHLPCFYVLAIVHIPFCPNVAEAATKFKRTIKSVFVFTECV